MQDQEPPQTTDHPSPFPQAVPGAADEPTPHREEHTSIRNQLSSLSSHFPSFSPQFRMVAGMAGMMLLVLGTLCSVSCYQLSAQVSGMVIGLFFIFFVYSVVVAARCRRRPTDTHPQD